MSRGVPVAELLYECLQILSRAAAAEGEAESAARFEGAAASLYDSKGAFETFPNVDRLAAAREKLGEMEWEREWRRGAALTAQQALEDALEACST